ncbi:UvrD-helicase domain-containing protein [Aliidiomarina indica]|uniref:UvrD-helicase domain-containing protein n=1 Tax=Aliidiomarina indica TaxID=2749147 RepID=UPI00188FB378|nr:UvrD-helicase domain-containing protein [Aliidiomarina indica]
MDKRVVFAVAGAGKTSLIINSVTEDSRCLIITYTDNNTDQLVRRIIKKLGCIPKGVRVYSYFSFLYAFCYRPILGYDLKTKGINFDYPLPKYAQFSKMNKREHYIDKNGRVFSNRISKLLIKSKAINKVLERIEKFFDSVYIDEIQDLSGNDFNFACELAKLNVNVCLVGDFYQHTFKTSIDLNVQKSLHDSFEAYSRQLIKAGYTIDLVTLSNSYRCPPAVCSFVEDNLGINIGSNKSSEVEVRLIDRPDEIDAIYADNSIVKLFYQKSNKYTGNTDNWGNTKGIDHHIDVCAVLNPTTYKAFKQGRLASLAATTRNKLYVACTRANGNLYFVDEKFLSQYKK